MMFQDPPNFNLTGNTWLNVGVHPTPLSLAGEFAESTIRSFAQTKLFKGRQKTLKVLDACSGDGRLGHAVAQRLVALGWSVDLSLLEIDTATSVLKCNATGYGVSVHNRNFLTEASKDLFDLVISNPPYKLLNRSDANRLGLDWRYVRLAGRNLYGLSIIRAIEACKVEGLVAFIAPHGWLNNQHCQELREIVSLNTSEVCVEGFRRRNLFPGVSQDVAFQFFRVREPDPDATTKVKFVMEGVESQFPLSETLHTLDQEDHHPDDFRVRVGPLVWNREKELLHSNKRGIPVINGGNIGADEKLILDLPLYRERQYARNRILPASYVSKAPFIAIKRTMRGRPGHWHVDAVLVSEKSFKCVAENHVIVVEPVTPAAKHSIRSLVKTLRSHIERLHRLHGHANISVELVRLALKATLKLTVIRRGEPGYAPHLDRDGDGIACEPYRKRR